MNIIGKSWSKDLITHCVIRSLVEDIVTKEEIAYDLAMSHVHTIFSKDASKWVSMFEKVKKDENLYELFCIAQKHMTIYLCVTQSMVLLTLYPMFSKLICIIKTSVPYPFPSCRKHLTHLNVTNYLKHCGKRRKLMSNFPFATIFRFCSIIILYLIYIFLIFVSMFSKLSAADFLNVRNS